MLSNKLSLKFPGKTMNAHAKETIFMKMHGMQGVFWKW
jgi:hypothetical protein